MTKSGWVILLMVIMLLSLTVFASAFDRVPRPEFETDYVYPELQTPDPRAPLWEYIDVAVLAVALGVSTWLSLRSRSRVGIVILSLFSIAYFGFFRKGCICPVGSIQNVAYALFNSGYAIPVTVVLIFLLPLLTALFAGRTFCSSVCALGAIQDLVVIKPAQVPRWLSVPLGLFPLLYLGLSVLYAATGTDFIICRFDPFVSVFRLAGPINILLLGAIFLVAGTVIARPYCRFVCPYGVILGWLSSVSLRHATITPDSCIRCGLCTDACPVDAIESPSVNEDGTPVEEANVSDRKKLSIFLIVLPLILIVSAWAGGLVSPVLSRLNSDIRLAEQLTIEQIEGTGPTTLETETFRASTDSVESLFTRAASLKARFKTGSTLLGLFAGFAFCFVYVGAYRRKRMQDWRIRASDCVNCGRCFSYCPREHALRSAKR